MIKKEYLSPNMKQFEKIASIGSSAKSFILYTGIHSIGNLNIMGDYRANLEVKISKEAVHIETNTREQSRSALWFKEREKRLMASNFEIILNRKSVVTQKCVDNIMTSRQFSSKPADQRRTQSLVTSTVNRKKNHVIMMQVQTSMILTLMTPEEESEPHLSDS